MEKTKLSPPLGETERLIIMDSIMEDCVALQQLNEISDYIADWVGWNTTPDYEYYGGGYHECSIYRGN